MTRRLLPLALLTLLCTCDDNTAPEPTPPNPQHVSVLTQHNDNTRAGWNADETALTTSNVNVDHFGALFTLAVDDQVYAQPLVIGGLPLDNDSRNVVYVATVNNTVYAFDGEDGTLYWQKNFTAAGMRPPRNTDMSGACGGGYTDFSGNIGIVGTPVIDAGRSTIYFVTRSTNGTLFVQHLHAVDVYTGAELAGSPVALSATYPGSGDGSVNGTITFDPQKQNQRQALTLVNGVVYISFSSHCDWGPYHGWILGYDASTLAQRSVYNDTPEGYGGGMWESGMGMAADDAGNLYALSGNGTVGLPNVAAAPINRAESALKLAPTGSTLEIRSYFTPTNFQFANDQDLDYGSMGSLLIKGAPYFFTGGKDGNLYLLNQNDMGAWSASHNQNQQVITLGAGANMHCQAAFYWGSADTFVYVWSENDPLRAIPFNRATNMLDIGAEIANVQGGPTGQSGAMLSVSSNGQDDATGILWAAYARSGDAEHDVSPGILRAFDAHDVSKELWNSRQNATRDDVGMYAKFASPTIANGHVYLPTFSNRVVVYGLLP